MTSPSDLTAEDLIRKLQKVAREARKQSVSLPDFMRATGLSEWQIRKYCDSWNDLVTAAGLLPNNNRRLDDNELFRAMEEALVSAGGVSTIAKFDKLCRYNYSVYKRRPWGGTWQNMLASFREWALVNAPDFPYMDQLPIVATAPAVVVGQKQTPAWVPRGGRHYGPFLNFRGLQHAPINEQGVVFLFGMVAMELGYVVESVATGYPDCEAKRRVSRTGDTWERVRIEFEYQSRTFLTHGHDPAQCDVIVCWENNWPDCPLEVLELKTAIQKLED